MNRQIAESTNSSRTPAWDIVVVGGANTDCLVRGPHLPQRGETAQGDEFRQAPGGKGANQAVAVARLGARVAFVGRIGRDERGDHIMDRLRAEGVDTQYVVRDDSAFTGVALVMVEEGGEKQILAAPGANRRLEVVDVEAATEIITHTKFVLTQLETSVEIAHAIAGVGDQTGVQLILDPSPPVPLPDDLLKRTAVIKPNSKEAQALTGIEVKDRETARQAAGQLLQRGVGAVAIQAGEAGNVIVWREGERFMPKLPVKSVDATGAGDAFVTALAVALAEGKSLEEAGPFANAAAALTTCAGRKPSMFSLLSSPFLGACLPPTCSGRFSLWLWDSQRENGRPHSRWLCTPGSTGSSVSVGTCDGSRTTFYPC